MEENYPIVQPYTCSIDSQHKLYLTYITFGSKQYFMFLSSGMHIFKHFYLLTLASRGHYPVFLALSVKVVLQEHLFVDHF